ncbi:hypothetical protein BMS3Abin10_02069 [bacterium BMS3Abin10]|nr:hypothetical protein BMS3Abin10_02069 [bacterium BMS3Abin10]GBE37997.1 hypothetical protein BMS3Bbin08_00596 [bacterium BMS3Bbin08]
MFFFAPVVILQSSTNYVDVAVGVLFLMAINFLLYDSPQNPCGGGRARPVQSQDKRIPMIVSGIAAGILLGSKGSGPLFIVVISGVVMVQEVAKRFNLLNIMSSGSEDYSL